MPRVALRQCALRANVGYVTRLRQTEEILGGGKLLRVHVATLELEVMGQPLGGAHKHSVIGRSAGVLVCAYGIKPRVRSRAEIEEALMARVRLDNREVGIPFAKQPVSENSDIANIQNEVPSDLPSYRRI